MKNTSKYSYIDHSTATKTILLGILDVGYFQTSSIPTKKYPTSTLLNYLCMHQLCVLRYNYTAFSRLLYYALYSTIKNLQSSDNSYHLSLAHFFYVISKYCFQRYLYANGLSGRSISPLQLKKIDISKFQQKIERLLKFRANCFSSMKGSIAFKIMNSFTGTRHECLVPEELRSNVWHLGLTYLGRCC